MPSFSITPPVSGNSTWDLAVNGPLVLNTAGQWDIVPSTTFSAAAKLWAAGGAAGANASPPPGGGGGAITGTVTLSSGVTYRLTVGAGTSGVGNGGAGLGYGGSGGGFTRILSVSPVVFAMVAGGGGGGGQSGYTGGGGPGGGASGLPPSSVVYDNPTAQPGTQLAGGAGGVYGGSGGAGSQFIGGAANTSGAGGGSGYYGGGAGSPNGGGSGAGGSGYFDPGTVSGAILYAGLGTTPGNAADPDRGTAGVGGVIAGSNGNPGLLQLSIPPTTATGTSSGAGIATGISGPSTTVGMAVGAGSALGVAVATSKAVGTSAGAGAAMAFPPGPIIGTLSQTLGSVTISATGIVPITITGTLTQTLSPITLYGLGYSLEPTMTLSAYITSVQNLLNDPGNQFYNTGNLTAWINQARQHVAMDTQCVRVLPPSSGSINSITATGGGTGYTTATVEISAPDAIGNASYQQATATATILAGVITAINVTNAGTGYVAQPTITIVGNGSGASGNANLTQFVKLTAGVEVYPFSQWNGIVISNFVGVKEIFAVQSMAVSWGAMKPMVNNLDWSGFQAYLRSYNIGFQNYPTFFSQYGQGVNGSLYVWPVPSVDIQTDIDCYCDVVYLVDDTSVEAIPYPFTEAVQYYATYLAYLNAQRKDDAQFIMSEYKRVLNEARVVTTPPVVPSFYDGYA